MGVLARLSLNGGQDARTTRNFGTFFYLEVPNSRAIAILGYKSPKEPMVVKTRTYALTEIVRYVVSIFSASTFDFLTNENHHHPL